EIGEPECLRVLERPRVEETDEVRGIVEALERVSRAVEDPGGVVEAVVEEVAPCHRADLPGEAEIGREQRALGSRKPPRPDRELIVSQWRHVAAYTHLETAVRVIVDESVEQVEAVQPPVDREDVLDGTRDPAVEEEPLAGEEEAVIGRDGFALPPDS